MKKTSLILFFAFTVSLISCSDDDGPSIAYQYAEITGHNLPDYMEFDEEYDVDITYLLPDACNTFYTFDGSRGEDEDDESVYVYTIVALTSYDPNLTECSADGDLSKTKTLFKDFKLSKVIESEEKYDTVRFRFLKSVGEENEGEYVTVNVPVGEPEPTPEEPTE